MGKLGLVLEGGAARCAYQTGVLHAFDDAGITYDAISGTSMGALNGVAYVQEGYKGLEEVWDDIKETKFFDISDDMISRFKRKDFDIDMLFYPGKKLTALWEEIHSSYEVAKKYIAKELDENKVRNSKCDFGLVTYNMTDLVPVEKMIEEIPEGQLFDYLLASSSFPVFPPLLIDGKKYINGDIFDNQPITLLKDNGIEKMIVIRVHPKEKAPKRKANLDNLKLYYIEPEKDLGLNMSFSTEHVNTLIALGYQDGKKALENGILDFIND